MTIYIRESDCFPYVDRHNMDEFLVYDLSHRDSDKLRMRIHGQLVRRAGRNTMLLIDSGAPPNRGTEDFGCVALCGLLLSKNQYDRVCNADMRLNQPLCGENHDLTVY